MTLLTGRTRCLFWPHRIRFWKQSNGLSRDNGRRELLFPDGVSTSDRCDGIQPLRIFSGMNGEIRDAGKAPALKPQGAILRVLFERKSNMNYKLVWAVFCGVL